jgi:hypothetical protein
MADHGSLRSASRVRTYRRGRCLLFVVIAMILVAADVADAKITIRPNAPNDNFFFHGNYSTVPFDPATDFGVQIWNCADGTQPMFLSLPVPLVVCALDPDGSDHLLANLVYTVEVPAGTCVDHGSSCYYRDRAVSVQQAGVRYFRVRYARAGRGNRVWLDTYGDLSTAQHANMLIVITIDGVPRAMLEDTFRSLRNGGWFSLF